MFDKCSDFRIQYIESKIYIFSLQGTLADVTMKVEAITSKKNHLPYNPSLIRVDTLARIDASEARCIIISVYPLKFKETQICPHNYITSLEFTYKSVNNSIRHNFQAIQQKICLKSGLFCIFHSKVLLRK